MYILKIRPQKRFYISKIYLTDFYFFFYVFSLKFFKRARNYFIFFTDKLNFVNKNFYNLFFRLINFFSLSLYFFIIIIYKKLY